MSEYHFWYKSSVNARNLEEAISKEKKIKPELSSIEHKNEEMSSVTAIGFNVEQYEDKM